MFAIFLNDSGLSPFGNRDQSLRGLRRRDARAASFVRELMSQLAIPSFLRAGNAGFWWAAANDIHHILVTTSQPTFDTYQWSLSTTVYEGLALASPITGPCGPGYGNKPGSAAVVKRWDRARARHRSCPLCMPGCQSKTRDSPSPTTRLPGRRHNRTKGRDQRLLRPNRRQIASTLDCFRPEGRALTSGRNLSSEPQTVSISRRNSVSRVEPDEQRVGWERSLRKELTPELGANGPELRHVIGVDR